MIIFENASWGLFFALCSLHKSHSAFSAVLMASFETRSNMLLMNNFNSESVSINLPGLLKTSFFSCYLNETSLKSLH